MFMILKCCMWHVNCNVNPLLPPRRLIMLTFSTYYLIVEVQQLWIDITSTAVCDYCLFVLHVSRLFNRLHNHFSLYSGRMCKVKWWWIYPENHDTLKKTIYNDNYQLTEYDLWSLVIVKTNSHLTLMEWDSRRVTPSSLHPFVLYC